MLEKVYLFPFWEFTAICLNWKVSDISSQAEGTGQWIDDRKKETDIASMNDEIVIFGYDDLFG